MITQLKILWRKVRNKRKQTALKESLKKWDKVPGPNKNLSEIKSICLLRWDNKLGDAIISSSLIACLNKYRPDIKLTVITGKISALWFSDIEDVTIIESPRRSLKTAQCFASYKGMFDVVIDLGSSFSEKELVALSSLGASYYIGYNKEQYNLFNVHIDSKHINMLARYKAVATLFLDSDEFNFQLPSPDFQNEINKFLSVFTSLKNDKYNVIAMNFLGSGKYRRFSKIEALSLIDRWLDENLKDYLVFIPVPDEYDFLRALKKECAHSDRVLLIEEKASIKNTLAILSLSDFCFTPDTSVVHMASAIDSPILAIYGGNKVNFEEWKPLSKNSEVVFNPKRKNKNERISVVNFSWDKLMLGREKILNRNKGPYV